MLCCQTLLQNDSDFQSRPGFPRQGLSRLMREFWVVLPPHPAGPHLPEPLLSYLGCVLTREGDSREPGYPSLQAHRGLSVPLLPSLVTVSSSQAAALRPPAGPAPRPSGAPAP